MTNDSKLDITNPMSDCFEQKLVQTLTNHHELKSNSIPQSVLTLQWWIKGAVQGMDLEAIWFIDHKMQTLTSDWDLR